MIFITMALEDLVTVIVPPDSHNRPCLHNIRPIVLDSLLLVRSPLALKRSQCDQLLCEKGQIKNPAEQRERSGRIRFLLEIKTCSWKNLQAS